MGLKDGPALTASLARQNHVVAHSVNPSSSGIWASREAGVDHFTNCSLCRPLGDGGPSVWSARLCPLPHREVSTRLGDGVY